jgi:predicted phosphodiesterase
VDCDCAADPQAAPVAGAAHARNGRGLRRAFDNGSAGLGLTGDGPFPACGRRLAARGVVSAASGLNNKHLTRTLLLAPLAAATIVAQTALLPNRPDSVKFAAIGDNGTGDRPQFEIAQQMTNAHGTFPFDLVIMLGDNMYGGQRPGDFVKKFEQPYAALLSAGVKFQASLGNHDRPENVSYKPFNMNGQRYYTFANRNVRFFALDSTQLDSKQLVWIDASLRDAREDWKICYFHHPLYSNASRHGPSVDLRVLLEPIFIKYGVNVVITGHDHVYERLNPQKGIYYFVSGSAGQLRKGNIRRSDETAAFFDQDQSFMLVEIAGSDCHFQAISRTGKTVDSGVIHRQRQPRETGRTLDGGASDRADTVSH